MVSIQQFRQLALALPGAEEKPHFDMPSFRVNNKIFATIHAKNNRVMIKLPPVVQSAFCAIDKAIIYPVPGAWGAGGATLFELANLPEDILQDALLQAWLAIAPKKLKEANGY